MSRPIIVIDDDLELVRELRLAHGKKFSDQQIVGPPELCLDLLGVGENIKGAGAVVLDLNIAGSNTYGQALLKNLRRELERSDTPVIVWSKYLVETVVFEPAGISRLSSPNGLELPFKQIEEKNLTSLADNRVIHPLRTIYAGTRAFVSKATPDPVSMLLLVFARLGVVSREL